MYIKASGLQADICVCGANKYFNDTKKMALNASGYLNMKYISGEVFNRKQMGIIFLILRMLCHGIKCFGASL